jgi:hypothetical protein
MRRQLLALGVVGLITMRADAAVKVEKTEYKGWVGGSQGRRIEQDGLHRGPW